MVERWAGNLVGQTAASMGVQKADCSVGSRAGHLGESLVAPSAEKKVDVKELHSAAPSAVLLVARTGDHWAALRVDHLAALSAAHWGGYLVVVLVETRGGNSAAP